MKSKEKETVSLNTEEEARFYEELRLKSKAKEQAEEEAGFSE